MIGLDDYIVDLKRSNQYGDTSVTNDSATADLVRWINRYKRLVANMTAWSWLLKTFDVAVVAGEQDITLDSSVSKVVAIYNGYGAYLQKITVKEALSWHTPTVSATAATVLGYFINLGVDTTTGAQKIRVYGEPGTSVTLSAYGLSKFSDIAVADIGTSANFLPFPDAVMNIISDLVSAMVAKAKGEKNWNALERLAWDSMRVAMGEEQSDPSDDVTTPLPPYYQIRKILRRDGLVG